MMRPSTYDDPGGDFIAVQHWGRLTWLRTGLILVGAVVLFAVIYAVDGLRWGWGRVRRG